MEHERECGTVLFRLDYGLTTLRELSVHVRGRRLRVGARCYSAEDRVKEKVDPAPGVDSIHIRPP